MCSLIRFYSCNVLTICHSLITGQRSELELRIKIIKSRLLPATAGLKADRRRPDISLTCGGFGSPRLVKFALRTVICNDGWGDAWKSRASPAAHQDFLIGLLAASSGRQMAAMVPKSDSQNQESDIPVHKVLPKNVYSLSQQTIRLSDSDYTLIDEVGVFCVCKQVL